MQTSLSRRLFNGAASTAAMAAAAQLANAVQSPTPASGPAPTPGGSPGARTYDIREYGAKGDGSTLDTAAVQAAIDACARDEAAS